MTRTIPILVPSCSGGRLTRMWHWRCSVVFYLLVEARPDTTFIYPVDFYLLVDRPKVLDDEQILPPNTTDWLLRWFIIYLRSVLLLSFLGAILINFSYFSLKNFTDKKFYIKANTKDFYLYLL